MDSYSMRDVQSLLGIPRTVVSALIAAGVIAPRRGARHAYRFTFQDVVLLRTAQSLRESRIPTRHITRSLKRLQGLDEGRPPTGLRVTAVGGDVTVHDRHGRWHVESGQFVLDFGTDDTEDTRDAEATEGVGGRGAKVVDLRRLSSADDPVTWFERGSALEDDAPAAAEQAYKRAVAAAPDYLDAWLNLGCMLCDHSRFDEAVACYRMALEHLPDQPLLHFNLGVALEDAGALRDALGSYHACIELAPDFADAHYNAARLHEELGDPHRAIRHYNQYRKLEAVE
jgi:hypothetical protein